MTMTFAALSLLALAQPAAVPPPVEQTSADCAQPTYASDMLVCDDSELKARDAELAALVASAPIAGTAVMESDADWFKRSRRCAFSAEQRACLAGAYAERLALRAALAAVPQGESKRSVCIVQNKGKGATFTKATDGKTLVIRDATSQEAIGALFPPAAKGAAWEPFARYIYRTDRISVSTLGDVLWICRI